MAAGAVYVVTAILGVAVPILVMVALGDRAPAILRGWNVWLRQNNATVMSVQFVVFGVVLVSQGMPACDPGRPADSGAPESAGR